MNFALVDFSAYLFYGLKWLVFSLAWLMLLLGLDDLFIDLVYWGRLVKRRLGIYRREPRADEELLYSVAEQPLAIMIPAWQEVGVVGEMARLAASTLDYENYQIFVGTYPNDPETQADVEAVCQQYQNVHQVVCARPGPTSKADCLNNVIDAILGFEASARVQFAGFILHDAEDVVSPMELRLFNFLLPRKDLIQIPVYPYAPDWKGFTAGHYVDEFAEYHGKDVVVREALIGQVPSAGVGTCFSRRAITALLEEGDGVAFDVQSLTEDYDIGFRLKQKGMNCIFARYHVTDPALAPLREVNWGVSPRSSRVICVREHFPRSLGYAIRQKSRWIVGIVFQGTRTLGWSKDWKLNYFLWRDRRGALANLLGLLVNALFLILLGLWLSASYFPNAWHFPSLLGNSPTLKVLLWLNGLLLLNRLFQRFYFVNLYYGVGQGLLSAPRMMWSNLVNFLANVRAIRQVLQMGDSRRVAWDKTTHEFPAMGNPRRQPIGLRLVEIGALSKAQLEEVVVAPRRRLLGRELLVRGLIDSAQLTQVLAEQADLEWAQLDPFTLDPRLIEALPARLALRYSVLPIGEDGKVLILASERATSEVSLGVISRQLKRPVRCSLAPQGRVTLGLRHWYGNANLGEQERAVLAFLAERHRDAELMEQVCRHQVLLGDLIQEYGHLPPSLLGQALMDFDPANDSLGEHLIERGLISRQTLEQALHEQQVEQNTAYELLKRLA